MEEKELDSLREFYDRLRDHIRKRLEKTKPTSIITLTALRETNPQFAKKIFVESIITPAKEALGEHIAEETARLFEDVESRFLQEQVTALLYEVETITATRFIWSFYAQIESSCEVFLLEPSRQRENQSQLTNAGFQLLKWVTDDAVRMITELGAIRETRVQLMLTTAAAGEDAVTRAMAECASYKHGSILQSVWAWLKCNHATEPEIQRKLAEYFSEGGDERIEAGLVKLIACAFSSGNMRPTETAWEIFTGEEEIEF